MEISESAEGEGWLMPVDGYITSVFGDRVNPVLNKDEFHNGLDIACEAGTPAKAVSDGIVLEAGVSPTYGNYLRYDVGGGYKVFYAHLSEVLVKEGQSVKRGDVVAKTGNTGLTTGPHLHLTVYEGNAEANPLAFFDYK